MRFRKTLLAIYSGALMFFLIYFSTINSVCDRFYFVRGYDICKIPSLYISFLFFILAASLCFFLPKRQVPSSVVIWTVYLMNVFGSIYLHPYFAPQISINGLIYVIMIFVTFALSSYAIQYFVIEPKFIFLNKSTVLWIVIAISLFFLFVFLRTFGINFEFASIFDVYGVRGEFKENLGASGSRLTAYATLFIGFLFAPFLIVVGGITLRGNITMGFFMIILGLISASQVYATAAFKSVAAISVLSVVFSILIGRSRYPLYKFLTAIFVLILVLSILQITNVNTSALDHWFRRAFISPGMNTNFYLEEFGWFNFGDSASAPLTISLDYYGTQGSANTGIYGNGFARAGVFGVIFNLTIFVIFCIILDGVTKYVPASVSFPMAFITGYAFSNSATTAVMVSYGGIMLVIMLYLLSGSLKRDYGGISEYC